MEKGRDYQLVCGLDVPENFAERDPFVNNQKSNRFLPYRHPAPTNPGDWTFFLDPDTETWVWAEFLGSWWHEKAARYDGKRRQKHGPRPKKRGPYKTRNGNGKLDACFEKVVVWKQEDPDLTWKRAFERVLKEFPQVTEKQKKTFQRQWKRHGWDLPRNRDKAGRWSYS